MALTPKRLQFALEYVVDLNATQAAIRAGYATKGARAEGARLLADVDVQAEVARLQAKRAEKLNITADWVLKQAVLVHEKCLEVGDYAQANRSLEIAGKHVNVQAFNERATVHHEGEVKLIERRIRKDAD